MRTINENQTWLLASKRQSCFPSSCGFSSECKVQIKHRFCLILWWFTNNKIIILILHINISYNTGLLILEFYSWDLQLTYDNEKEYYWVFDSIYSVAHIHRSELTRSFCISLERHGTTHFFNFFLLSVHFWPLTTHMNIALPRVRVLNSNWW